MVTSVWTHYMGLAAIGGTAFGIIGVFLVLATFREAKRSADAAHDANRPWLSIEAKITGFWVTERDVSVDTEIALFNHGNAPATDVALALQVIASPASWLPDTSTPVDLIKSALREIDGGRPRGGSMVFPNTREEDTLAADTPAANVIAVVETGHQPRFLVAVGVSYMFGERPCHTARCYDVFVREHVTYCVPNQMHRVRLFDVSDIYAGFAT